MISITKAWLLFCVLALVALTGGIVLIGVAALGGKGAGGSATNTCASSGSSGSTDSSAVVSKNPELFQAVKNATIGDNRLTLAMLVGSYLESGYSNEALGGGAYGPFQIQHPAGAPAPGKPVHPDITVAQAADPAYATQYMLPAYQAGMNQVDSGLWATNPEAAAEETAYAAERPAASYYDTQGAERVREAYEAAVSVMNSLGILTNFSGSVAQEAAANMTPGCSSSSVNVLAANVNSSAAAVVIVAAQNQIGLPYSWGGGNLSGPSTGICASGAAANDCHIVGFDCSGLTQYAFGQISIDIGSTAAVQWYSTRQYEVPQSQAQPGDLVFFTGDNGSRSAPGHVGIYVGNGRMINAPESGQLIKISDITTAYWQNSLVGFTRPYASAVSQA